MTCQEMMELMQRDLDQDLTAGEQQIMLDHLDQCPDCADLYTRLQLLSDELAQLPRVTPPYSIVDAILPQLEDIETHIGHDAGLAAASERCMPATGGKVVPLAPRRGMFSWKIFSGVAAAGIVLGMFLFNNGGQNNLKRADIGETQMLAGSNSATASQAGAAPSAEPKGKMDADLNKVTTVPEAPVVSAGGEVEIQATSSTAAPRGEPKASAKPSTVGKPTPGKEVSMASTYDLPFTAFDQYGESASPAVPGSEGSAGKSPSSPPVGEAAKRLYTDTGAVEPSTGMNVTGSLADSFAAKEMANDAKEDSLPEMADADFSRSSSLMAPKADYTVAAIQPLASPDGKHTAQYREGSVVIIAADETVVFTSTAKLSPGETVMFIGWKDKGVFDYSITSVKGTTAVHRIVLGDKQETVLP